MRFIKRAMVAALLTAAIPFLAPGLANNGPTVVGSAAQSGTRVTIKASGQGLNASGSVRVAGEGPAQVFDVTCLMASGNEAWMVAVGKTRTIAVGVIDSKQGDELFVMDTTDPDCAAPTGSPTPVSSGNYRVTGGDTGGGLSL